MRERRGFSQFERVALSVNEFLLGVSFASDVLLGVLQLAHYGGIKLATVHLTGNPAWRHGGSSRRGVLRKKSSHF